MIPFVVVKLVAYQCLYCHAFEVSRAIIAVVQIVAPITFRFGFVRMFVLPVSTSDQRRCQILTFRIRDVV